MKKRGKTFVGLERCLDACEGIERNARNVCEEIEYLATYYVNFTKADLKSLVCVVGKLVLVESGTERCEIETGAAIRAAEAVRAIPTLKLSDRKHLAKLIKEARIARSRRRGNTANTEEVQEEEEEEGEGNNSDTNDVSTPFAQLPDEILREIFILFKSKTDVAVASCVCIRWERVLSCLRKEKSTWYAALQLDRETGRCKTDDGRLMWETKVKSKSNSSIYAEEYIALKSKEEVYAVIRENVRSQRRREIDSDFSDTTSEDDEDDEDDHNGNNNDTPKVMSHRFWNISKYLRVRDVESQQES